MGGDVKEPCGSTALRQVRKSVPCEAEESYFSLLSYPALAVCQRLRQGLWVPPELRAALLTVWGNILKHASESSRLHGCERIHLPENILGAYETSSHFL